MTIKIKIKKKPVQAEPTPASSHQPSNVTNAKQAVPTPTKGEVVQFAKPVPLPKTLAQLRERITQSTRLTSQQIRDMRSAILSVGKATGRPLSQIPTDVPKLRDILTRVHPARMGISQKRFANIRSGLERAMIETGLLPSQAAREHSPAWRTFLALTTVKEQAWGLSRFAGFCSGRGIGPMDVGMPALDAYQAWLEVALVSCDPAKAARDAGKNFNAILRRAELDRPLLALRRTDRYQSRPLETYPQSFQDDLNRYIERLRNPDLFDEDGPDRPLKDMSVRNICAHVRQLADAAVLAGYDPDQFKGLADLVQISVLDGATKAIRTRTGQEFSGSLLNIITTARNIAVHYVKLPPKDLEQIAKAKAKIAKATGYNNPRLTEKNQARLAPFADGETFKQLVMLPLRLMAEANKDRGSPRAAMDAMASVAIAILLCCPMRAKNLASLDIQRHLIRRKEGKKILYGVHVSADETKNRQGIDFDLSESVSILLHEYLEIHHPVLATDTSFLFPRSDGRHRDPGKLGEMVEGRIWNWLGLEVNLHLFRHLTAMQYLEVYPGQYESVRRILCHAKIDTTTGYYAGLSNKAIQQQYHEGVLGEALKPVPAKAKGKTS